MIFWDCFSYLYKIPDIPGYRVSVSKAILSHLKHVSLNFVGKCKTRYRASWIDHAMFSLISELFLTFCLINLSIKCNHLNIFCLKFSVRQVCQISPNRIITENRDKMLEFVRKIETFNDSTVSARLINILVPPLCQVDLDPEVYILYASCSPSGFT